MYLAGQSQGNDLGESLADVIIIENEKRPESTIGGRQSAATSSSKRDRETHPTRQHQNAQRLRNDEDDGDNNEQEEEESPDDNLSATERHAPPRIMLIGWDTFRSRLMLFLIACFLVWAFIFFPLLAT